MKKQQGFTLIELMIVVAIIAILAAIALPAYQDYVARSQVSEGLSLASASKTAATEFYANKGRFPTSNASAGVATAASVSGKYVTSVAVGSTAGQITITYGNQANAKIASSTLVLSAITNQGSTDWVCKAGSSSGVNSKYLPSSCRR